MTILLAGATGFLGSYLLKKLVSSKHEVIALKRAASNTYRIETYLEKVTLYDVDVMDVSDVFVKHDIDVVINTVTNYGRKETQIVPIVETNLMFGLSLLENAVSHKVRAFINTDTLLQKQINAYALSKAQLVDWMKFLSSNSTKMINIKIEHMYGPLDDENKFIYWLINQLKANVEQVDLTSGIQKRDFIYIDDIINAYDTILNNIQKFENYEEFELGTGELVTVKEFVEKLYSTINQTENIVTQLNFGAIDYRDNENMCMQANISKFQKLGWSAKINIADGIKKILNEE